MLYYVTDSEFPSKKAHTIQQVNMCQGFERAGENVCLVHPSFGNLHIDWADIARYYGLETRFDVKTIPSIKSRFKRVPHIGYASMMAAMGAWFSLEVLKNNISNNDIIYGRGYYSLFIFSEIKKVIPAKYLPKLVYEHHDQNQRPPFKSRFFQGLDGCITTSEKLNNKTCASFSLDTDKTFTAYHGVNLGKYKSITQKEARKEIGMPIEDQVVMYTGHLYPRKGVSTLVRTASDIDSDIYIIGGYKKDINSIKNKVGNPNNVTYTGFIDPGQIHYYQIAADVLVAPYKRAALQVNFPLKILEYLAAEKPIVASRHEILNEILTDGNNVLFFEPENRFDLSSKIKTAFEDESINKTLRDGAHKTILEYSYDNRASKILEFVEN